MHGKKAKKLYAGAGAKGTVLYRFVTPKTTDDDEERMNVVLVGELKQVQGGKEKTVYTFRREHDGEERPLLSAIARYVKIVEEGDPRKYFDPKALENKLRGADSFKEPRVKWKKSKARRLLYQDLTDGVVPLADDPNMDVQNILSMREEYGEYDPDKFRSRLKSLRDAIRVSNTRADDDFAALETYRTLHKEKVSLFSPHGYIEFQGSEAQRLLLKDIADDLHVSMSKLDLYSSRPEYFNQFPLNVFRDRIYQEVRTAKYLHTCRVKGKLHKSS
jgi:hypothetical protein